ncbi:flagellar hook-length control protein FliK [Vibrio sp. LaRot3]|uniref:flagellar hook-length control protein FliK n=1 Tax=Vibrio sp. LaRot3 TaxID=2998829 RepID=UPI0022CE0C21|nr:flagellar hook-length control protein FliK [Vibrio sp. LaRot3]MDA0148073.1 flagellar hook-length control protein FliK [Vibrio sp. LaRot3]
MNVNLSPTTDAAKATKLSVDGSSSSSETSESEGFFSKLTSFIKGDSKAEKSADADADIKAATEAGKATSSEASEGEADVKAAESKQTEAVAKAQDSEESEAAPKSAQGASDKASIPAELERFIEKPADEATTKAASATQQAEQTVSENEELLGRLNQSSQALQPKDGNALPQDAKAVAVEESESGNAVATATAAGLSAGTIAATNAQSQTVAQASDKMDLAALQQAQSVEPETITLHGERIVLPANNTLEAPVVSAEQLDPETLKAMSEEEIAALKAMQDAQPATTQPTMVVTGTSFSAASSQVDGQAPIVAMTTEEMAQVTQNGETVAQGVVSAATNQNVDGVSPESVDPNAAVPMSSAAIAWSTNDSVPLTDAELAALAENQLKAGHKLAASPQAVQQAQLAALQAQQQGQTSQVIPQNMQPNMVNVASPEAAIAQQMQAMTAQAVAAPISPEQMVTKAALGANAAASIGKLSAKDGTNAQGADATIAQQLSHAAGQQGINNQMRAEQTAQAQPPMQLNKEMASDQVAERVQMMLSKNLKNIDIRLDPPELGRMQIRMNMNGDGATVHFTVANQQARDIVEQAMPRLREMLAQQGVQLGDTSVQQQSSGQQQGQYAAGNEGGSGQGNGNRTFSGEENLEPDVKLDLNVASKRDGISYYA